MPASPSRGIGVTAEQRKASTRWKGDTANDCQLISVPLLWTVETLVIQTTFLGGYPGKKLFKLGKTRV